MGVVNVTPDSFSGDGCLRGKSDFVAHAVGHARRLIGEGADIIDIGGESSRPGAARISVAEELSRVIPPLSKLARTCRVPVSVDTYKTTVARHALDAGASIVNTIKGTSAERSFLKMVQRYDAAIVLMHMRGTPRTMQKNIRYQNFIQDIIVALKTAVENCLESGIKSDRIILDPGIGFGKALEHNLEILNKLREFQRLKKPVLIGASRKSFIGKILDQEAPHLRLMGTVASVCAGVHNGAHVVRVHDVKAVREAVLVIDAIINHSSTLKSI